MRIASTVRRHPLAQLGIDCLHAAQDGIHDLLARGRQARA